MSKPVLYDFSAIWCGPCRTQKPKLEELKKKMGDAIEIKEIDVDENKELAGKYRISVVPTLIIEKDGKIIHTMEGVREADELEKLLKPLVG